MISVISVTPFRCPWCHRHCYLERIGMLDDGSVICDLYHVRPVCRRARCDDALSSFAHVYFALNRSSITLFECYLH